MYALSVTIDKRTATAVCTIALLSIEYIQLEAICNAAKLSISSYYRITIDTEYSLAIKIDYLAVLHVETVMFAYYRVSSIILSIENIYFVSKQSSILKERNFVSQCIIISLTNDCKTLVSQLYMQYFTILLLALSYQFSLSPT